MASTLVWSAITQPSEFWAMSAAVAGTDIVLATFDGKMSVYDTLTNTFSPVVNLPTSGSVHSVSVDTNNGYVFAVAGDIQGAAHVYRATYNTSTKAIGSWELKEPATGTGYFTGVFVAPNNDVFVTTQNAQDGPDTNGIYRSSNNGDSYARLTDTHSDPVNDNANFASFVGNYYLVGAYFSPDAGVNWNRLPQTQDGSNLNPNAGVINPANPEQAIISSDVGVAKTSNLSAGEAALLYESNVGLEGMIVYGMAQVADHKNRVVLASKSGVAFTDNFTDQTVNWTFPIFPMGNGAAGRAAVFDPSDQNRVFVGYNGVYQGIIDTSQETPITWTEPVARDSSHDFMYVSSMSMLGATKLWSNIHIY